MAYSRAREFVSDLTRVLGSPTVAAVANYAPRNGKAVRQECGEKDTRTRCFVFAVALLSTALLARASSGEAPHSQLRAKVVWAAGDRAYVVSEDSLGLGEEDVLTILDHRREVAVGSVVKTYEPGLVLVRITSGSLQRVKKLEKLRILISRTSTPAPSRLRLGYPSRSRSNLLFGCEDISIAPPGAEPYLMERLNERSYQILRQPRGSSSLWPDTLAVQLFDESADEEIALERGDLDVAIFWPGELSAGVREPSTKKGFLRGSRSRGVVCAVFLKPRAETGDVLVDRTALGSLNLDLFRGDLVDAPAADTARSGESSYAVPVEVNRGCPGWRALERAFNRTPRPLRSSDAGGTIHVFYADLPAGSPDSLSLLEAAESRRAWTGRADAGGDAPVRVLFAIRCPVLFDSAFRRYVERVGPDALVDLMTCTPRAKRP